MVLNSDNAKNTVVSPTLRELIFAEINFHEFCEVLTIWRKLLVTATREIRENKFPRNEGLLSLRKKAVS